jgi:hypothetical protein
MTKEKILDSDIIPFTATGENKLFSIFNYFGIVIIVVMLISFLFFAKSISAFISVLAILFLILFILRKAILKVDFGTNEIRIHHLYGNKKIVKYQQLRKFYKNREGFTPFSVFVLKYDSENSSLLKKFTFWTDEYSEEVLKEVLINKKNEST